MKPRFQTKHLSFGRPSLLILVFLFYACSTKYTSVSIDEARYSKRECLEVGDVENRYKPVSHKMANCLIYDVPSRYIQLLMKTLVGDPVGGSCNMRNGCAPPHAPFDSKLRRFGDDWPPYGYTMVGTERLTNLRGALMEVHLNGVEGSIMEFGVWRGGAMIFAAAVLEELNSSRDVYLFDAFGPISGKYKRSRDFLAIDVDTVKQNFLHFNLYDPYRVHFVKGTFSESVRPWYNRSDPVSVLRLDANFYDSYQEVLYALYENVPVGGIVIFDDIMSHDDVMRCWKEFSADHGLKEELVQIDNSCAWFRKRNAVRIDQSKKRPPKNMA
mmetsp:Transcript_37124/g.90246  ORF Transcript_37124/g.90246 Transcript_37124/m.90246 type:complete len:327 (-) Transcript_37124:321-1301(-)